VRTTDLNSVLGLKKLDVFMNERHVGTLALTKDHVVAFQYCDEWLASGFSISPLSITFDNSVQVPKYQPFEGLFGVFDDCLPDGWGWLLADRMLRDKGIEPSDLTSLSRLALIQPNSIGSLNFRPRYEETDNKTIENFDEIARECQKIFDNVKVPDIDKYYQMAGSSGGARPKVNALIDDEPWIVKFGSSLDAKNIGEKEYHYNELATKCGIDVAEHILIDSKICSGIFASKRFDYINTKEGLKKIHIVSAGGLLEVSHRVPALDYDHLLKLTLRLTQSMAEVKKMFRLMVFNVAIGNKDDHAKNFSYLYDEETQSWRLCPAYDLTKNEGMAGEHTTTINGKGKNISHQDLLEVGKRIGISAHNSKEMIEQVLDVVKTDS
jgi:serine/threonine-protein kinase HipA